MELALVIVVSIVLISVLVAAAFGYSVNPWQLERYTAKSSCFEFRFLQRKRRLLNFGLFGFYAPVPEMGPPTKEEESIFNTVYDAALCLWYDRVCSISRYKPRMWFVRFPEQYVRYGLNIKWNEIDQVLGEGTLDPERDGYGGLTLQLSESSYPAVYVSTYHIGRSPLVLLIHEFVHLLFDIRDGDSSFALYESKLRNFIFSSPDYRM